MAESMGLAADWLQPACAAWVAAALAAGLGMTLLRGALPAASAAPLARWQRPTVWALGLGVAAWLLAATQAMTDAPRAELPAALWLVLTQTTFGRTAQVALAAWLALVCLPVKLHVAAAGRLGLGPMLGLAALVALAYALAASGHVADQGLLSGAALVNSLHVLGAAAWAGTVAIGACVLRDWRAWTRPERSRLAHRLSRVATIAVPLALATGIANGVRMLGPAAHPAASPYSRLLAAKVILVGLAVLLGLWNRWGWLRRIDRGEDASAAAFAAILVFEALILVVVLGLAAKLGITQPPD